jgi:hypothetical protein
VKRVSIAEAAKRLRISESAVRRRIYGGSLSARKETTPQGHIWLVEMEDTQEPDAGDEGEVAVLRKLVDVLQAQVLRLETELEARRREISELHVLLQQSQRQIAAPTNEKASIRRFWPWGKR